MHTVKGGAELVEDKKAVPVDLDFLEVALADHSPEVLWYLDTVTGDVLMIRTYEPEDQEKLEQMEAHGPDRYRWIEPRDTREAYQDMVDFVDTVEDRYLQDQLVRAINGRGVFRRFKDALVSHAGERERWFRFHDDRIRQFVQKWLNEEGINMVPRTSELSNAP
jgi:hypothetical protein